MASCSGMNGSRAVPSPKSHQPSTPPTDRFWNVTLRPSVWAAKFATGFDGLMTLSISGEMYMSAAPEHRPTAVVNSPLSQPPDLGRSAIAVLLDLMGHDRRPEYEIRAARVEANWTLFRPCLATA